MELNLLDASRRQCGTARLEIVYRRRRVYRSFTNVDANGSRSSVLNRLPIKIRLLCEKVGISKGLNFVGDGVNS